MGKVTPSDTPSIRIIHLMPRHLDRSYAVRDFDLAFLADLPSSVDPCGEKGEFHTFVHDAPVFSSPIVIRTGEIVERDGFVFADVL